MPAKVVCLTRDDLAKIIRSACIDSIEYAKDIIEEVDVEWLESFAKYEAEDIFEREEEKYGR